VGKGGKGEGIGVVGEVGEGGKGRGIGRKANIGVWEV